MGSKKGKDLEKLIQAVSESIKHLLWKNFPELALNDLEDISQEVRYKIWKMISSGKNINNLRSYLWKVVYTTALDFLNKRIKYEDFHEEKEFVIGDFPGNIGDVSIESILEKKETKSFLIGAIETLSQNRRIVIKLSLKGMSVNEIADFLGWSNSKVNHLYYRGLEDLKKKAKDIR